MATSKLQQYVPGRAPTPSGDPADEASKVREWMEKELRNVAQTFANQGFVQATVLNEEPPRPRNGMIVYADGTDWNPGSGEGFYGYQNGAWVKL